MAFDSPPVPPAFMSPGTDVNPKIEFNVGGTTWTDFTSRVFENTTQIQRGHPDESTTASPTVFSGTLDNSDGVLSNLNPMSQYFGQLPLNTNVRVSIPDASSHMRLEADASSGAAALSASFNMTAFEVWIDASADNWYAPQFLAGRWNTNASDRAWMLYLPGDGNVNFAFTSNGGTQIFNIGSGALLPKLHGRLSIRIAYDPVTAQTGQFYIGQYCQNWYPLGHSQFTNVTIFPTSNQQLEVGNLQNFGDQAAFGGLPGNLAGFQGKIYAAALMPFGGTPAAAKASPDFTARPVGATSFTDAQSNTWNFYGTAYVDNRDYRFHGEAAAWPQTWTPGDPDYRVPLQGGGLLRRRGSTSLPVASAMYRACTKLTPSTGGQTPIAYWPCEDAAGSSFFDSPTPGVQNGTWTGNTAPNLAQDNTFVSSNSLPTVNGSTISFPVPQYTISNTPNTNSDAIVRMLVAMPSSGDNFANLFSVYYNGSKFARIDIDYSSALGVNAIGFDQSGNQIVNVNPADNLPGNPQRISLEVRNIGGGNISAFLVWLAAGPNPQAFQLPIFSSTAGTVGTVSKVVVNPVLVVAGGTPNPSNVFMKSVAFGHITVQSVWSSLFNMAQPMNAWVGENAGSRMQRLCAEEGIQFRGIGNMKNTVPMGPQTLQTLTTLMQECADVDRGMWYEPRQVLGWGYRSGVSLGNQPPQILFDYTQDQLSDTLEPTVDDQVLKNNIQVTSQSSGATNTQAKTTGPNSTTAVGTYDTQVTVNVGSDGQLADEAGWMLNTLTVNEPRYKAINCSLMNRAILANPALYYSILEADIGDRIAVQNPPVNLPPGLIDQLYQGSTEVISRKDLSESWNGVPAKPWNVAYSDDLTFCHADTDGSTLGASGVGSGAPTQQFPQAGFTPWPGWAESNATAATLPDGSLIVTATSGAAGGGFFQAFSSPIACSAGQTVGVVAKVQALTKVNGMKVGFGFGSTFPSDTPITLLAGQEAWLAFTATVPTGVTSFNATIVDGEAAPTGTAFRVEYAATGVCSQMTVNTTGAATGSPLWTVNANDFPFDISMGGEQITVVSISGSSSPQVFQVLRSINGVSKSHPVGENIALYAPAIAGLQGDEIL